MLLKVYTGYSSMSSRKAVKWLNDHDVDFHEIRMTNGTLSRDELKTLLAFTDNGLDDLLKRTVKTIFDELTLNQAIDSLIHNTHPLRSPILFDGKKLCVGYHEEDLAYFINQPNERLARVI